MQDMTKTILKIEIDISCTISQKESETFAQLHKISNYVIPAPFFNGIISSRYPVLSSTSWIPVFTGMTNKGAVQRSQIVIEVRPLKESSGD
jgi:hypothetical protein